MPVWSMFGALEDHPFTETIYHQREHDADQRPQAFLVEFGTTR